MALDPRKFLESLVGCWRGTCRTWFEPGQLADESPIAGEFQRLAEVPFVRHRYQGSIQGKTRTGEETLAFNSTSNEFEVAWFDSFHMNYGIMLSTGTAREQGCSVFGRYAVGGGHPPWGWRTEFELAHGDDRLTITAYNVTPDGEEAKAVETVYRRVTE